MLNQTAWKNLFPAPSPHSLSPLMHSSFLLKDSGQAAPGQELQARKILQVPFKRLSVTTPVSNSIPGSAILGFLLFMACFISVERLLNLLLILLWLSTAAGNPFTTIAGGVPGYLGDPVSPGLRLLPVLLGVFLGCGFSPRSTCSLALATMERYIGYSIARPRKAISKEYVYCPVRLS